jgi:hypothetical protein
MELIFWLVHHGVFAFGCGIIAGFALGATTLIGAE